MKLMTSILLTATAFVVSPIAAHAAVFSTTVEAGGPFGSTSFEASANDGFPAYGVVAFDASDFASFASTGVSPTVTLKLTEFVSTSSSTLTAAGGVVNFYFAQSPTTTAFTAYDSTLAPGGFTPANYNADLVGSISTYQNVANSTDTLTLTLSSSDVAYIDSLLASGTGSIEFFAVAATGTTSARWDGNFASALPVLTFTSASAVPEPASLGLIGLGAMGLLARRRK